MDMATRIKELRQAANLTQEELGHKLGLQKSAIAKYESGRVSNIKRSTIKKMADIFGCKPSYLMGFDDTKTEAIQLCKDVCGNNTEDMCELVALCFGEEVSDTFRKFMQLDEDDKKDIIDLMTSKLSREKYSGD